MQLAVYEFPRRFAINVVEGKRCAIKHPDGEIPKSVLGRGESDLESRSRSHHHSASCALRNIAFGESPKSIEVGSENAEFVTDPVNVPNGCAVALR